ncbi:putative ribonuclease H-like domain-containing protein, partial [Tanacetum coccineum]
DIIFGSTKKKLCTEFEKLMHKKFQMSSMSELTFFLGLQVTHKDDGISISQDKYVDEILKKFGFSTVKITSTPMETSKPLLKDSEAEDVNVHLYRTMIGSLMYLTSLRPDIMFADSPFDLEAYFDSDFEDLEFPDKLYKVEKALYGLHQAPRAWYETLFTYLLDNRFQRGQIDKTLFIKRVKSDILLVQVYVDDIIFGYSKKKLCTEFEKLMHKKFQMSYMASTPMETSKPFLKDAEAEDVHVNLYRSMIGSLMYLTSSRPDIMFAVCAYARFQVTPKVSHLHVVKRIFRYLKGQPKLGLWYPKDSPFDLEAYSNSDYAGASLDRKSTTGGCQFLGSKLISWQCKKQTIVANSTTEAKYVAAPTLVDGKKVIVTETSVRKALQLKDPEGTECLPNATIFAKLERTGAKTTTWNEFSSTMASAIIYLATNQKFNFSKYIFDNMVKNLEGGVKFLMYPRFVPMFLDKQVEGMSKHKKIYVTPSYTKKVFANMKRQGKDFFGRDTPLFPSMIVPAQEQVGEGSEIPTDSHHTPTTNQPSTSKPQKKQSKRKQRKNTQDSQPSGLKEPVADETENLESVVRID